VAFIVFTRWFGSSIVSVMMPSTDSYRTASAVLLGAGTVTPGLLVGGALIVGATLLAGRH